MTTNSKTALEPNVEDMLRHMMLLFDWTTDDFPGAEFEVRCIEPDTGRVRSSMFACSDIGYAGAATFAVSANHDGFNVYLTVNPVSPDTLGQAKDTDIEVARFQFIDVDGTDDPDLHIDARCEGYVPAFRVITGVQPTPRLHAYWRMSEPVRNMQNWREVQKGLAAQFDSDPAVVNPSRILRMAGTISHPDSGKKEKGYCTELVRLEANDDDLPEVSDPIAFADQFMLPEFTPQETTVSGDPAADDIAGSVPLAVVEAALKAIPPIAEKGRRNIWLDVACACKDANPLARAEFENWQRMSPFYRKADDRVWDTLSPSPNSYLSLFRHAKAADPNWWREDPEVAQWWRKRISEIFGDEPATVPLDATQIISRLAACHAAGQRIDVEMCIADLPDDPGEVRKVRDFASKTLKISAAEFNKAQQRKVAGDILGMAPETAMEFVTAFVEREGIVCRYNGILWRHGDPKQDIPFHELQRDMRVLADELRLSKLGIGHPQINDASEKWYAEAQRSRLEQIAASVQWDGNLEKRDQAQSALKQLAALCFECPEGPEFVAAVLLKFIHQVKRKMLGLPVQDHLMPVLLSPNQGVGKTTFIRQLTSPVEEVSMPTDFRQVTDDRIIALWKNHILIFDEMGWAKKADIETVKHIITARTLTRRPMRSNHTEEVQQNATLIGSANAMGIADLITDQTGTRRFVGLMMCDRPDWAAINAMDWLGLWRGVDPAAADPMAPFKELLRIQQEEAREKAPVEVWQDQIEVETFLGGELRNRRVFTREELFADFHEWEGVHFPRSATTITKFSRELGRVAKQFPETAKFLDDRKSSGRGWKWAGEVPAPKVKRIYA